MTIYTTTLAVSAITLTLCALHAVGTGHYWAAVGLVGLAGMCMYVLDELEEE